MMSRTQRTVTVGLWAIVVVGLIGLLGLLAAERNQARASAARDGAPAGVVLERSADGTFLPATQKAVDYTFPAPTFALTDQNDRPFDAATLKGEVWTAMFFFSECKGMCPSMTERITSLQKVTDDPRVQCVSFTADPTRDTPERLRKYAEKTKADPSRWHLLTGTYAQMKAVAVGFRLPFDQPSDHSSKIMLVDAAGTCRGYYESQDTEDMFRLMTDVKKLLAEVPASPIASAAR